MSSAITSTNNASTQAALPKTHCICTQHTAAHHNTTTTVIITSCIKMPATIEAHNQRTCIATTHSKGTTAPKQICLATHHASIMGLPRPSPSKDAITSMLNTLHRTHTRQLMRDDKGCTTDLHKEYPLFLTTLRFVTALRFATHYASPHTTLHHAPRFATQYALPHTTLATHYTRFRATATDTQCTRTNPARINIIHPDAPHRATLNQHTKLCTQSPTKSNKRTCNQSAQPTIEVLDPSNHHINMVSSSNTNTATKSARTPYL